jgi:hypothetical protein
MNSTTAVLINPLFWIACIVMYAGLAIMWFSTFLLVAGAFTSRLLVPKADRKTLKELWRDSPFMTTWESLH